MVKKGEDVAVGDDDDAVRTSVTKPSYSDTVYWGIVAQDSVYIK